MAKLHSISKKPAPSTVSLDWAPVDQATRPADAPSPPAAVILINSQADTRLLAPIVEGRLSWAHEALLMVADHASDSGRGVYSMLNLCARELYESRAVATRRAALCAGSRQAETAGVVLPSVDYVTVNADHVDWDTPALIVNDQADPAGLARLVESRCGGIVMGTLDMVANNIRDEMSDASDALMLIMKTLRDASRIAGHVAALIEAEACHG